VASPAAISLRFSEPLEPRFSSFDVKDRAGRVVKTSVHAEGADNSVLVGNPAAPLKPGSYKVAWRLVAKDGHRMQGVFPFTVH
jgi:methionine-rich copper-binding protein CopC